MNSRRRRKVVVFQTMGKQYPKVMWDKEAWRERTDTQSPGFGNNRAEEADCVRRC